MKGWALFIAIAASSALFAHPSASSGIAPAAKGATGNARIVVKILLNGETPASAKIQTTADPYCAEAHQAAPLFSQTAQVGADGALVDSLVFVSDGVSGTYLTPQMPVTLDQKGCVDNPHVIGMMAGRPLRIVEINNLPAGTFQLQPWHEKYGVQTRSVSVAAGEPKQLTVTYTGGA